MTKPADKWMQKAANVASPKLGLGVQLAIARALEATDKAATERAAQIAGERRLWPSSATLHTVGEVIATAIRKGTE